MKILTLGNGFIANHLPYERYTKKLPCDDALAFECRILDEYSPDVIINCIGKTGIPNVDWCEDNKLDTYLTNTTLPTIMASECLRKNIHFINIASGCIFSGESPNSDGNLLKNGQKIIAIDQLTDHGWKETDFANPQSYYAKTKYACDLAIGDLPNVCSLRIRMPIGSKNEPRNFINKVKGYKKVLNAQNSVTFVDELALLVDWVIDNQITGIYNATNSGTLSAVDVMNEYSKYVLDHEFESISSEELDKITLAKRSNCILDNSKLFEAGFNFTPAKEALKTCMKEYFK